MNTSYLDLLPAPVRRQVWRCVWFNDNAFKHQWGRVMNELHVQTFAVWDHFETIFGEGIARVCHCDKIRNFRNQNLKLEWTLSTYLGVGTQFAETEVEPLNSTNNSEY